jgi:uncharacterized protein YegL
MKPDFTEIVMILDRSGSMGHLEKDTIGSFTKFIKEQKAVPGKANLTMVLFNSHTEVLLNGKNLADVPDNFLDGNYVTSGMTALLDAMDSTIDMVGKRLESMKEEDRPSQVLIVTITDGAENSSTKCSKDALQEKIKHQTDVYGWKFMYLGADVAQMAAGASLGVQSKFMKQYTPDAQGVSLAYCSVSSSVRSLRTNTGDGDLSQQPASQSNNP